MADENLMDSLEELQKKQNAVSLLSGRLRDYLTHSDKPDEINSAKAMNVLCVYIPLQLRSEKEKQTSVIENSPPISMVPVRARRLVPVCCRVGMCLCMFMWAHATLLLR